MRTNWRERKGVSIGAIVLIGAVFTFITALLWGVATESRYYQIQLERTPSIKAKARFDHLKHYSNYSLWLAGHWGTDKYGGKEKIWWEKGSNLVPSQEEFARRLGSEISDRYTHYFGWEDATIEDPEVNVTGLDDGTFKINSTPALKVSPRREERGIFEEEQKEVEMFDELNHTHPVNLRIFLLRDSGEDFVEDNLDTGTLREEISAKLESETKQHEKKSNTRCLPVGDKCSGGDYPGPNPDTASELTHMLNDKLGGIADRSGSGDLSWTLSVKELNAEIGTKKDKWTQDTGKSCKCRVNVAVEEEWVNTLDCARCEVEREGCYNFVSCGDRDADGDCVNCTVKLSEERVWGNTNDCEGCKGGNNCIEFIESLKNKTKCWAEYWHSYNVTPTVKAVVEDQNNRFKIFGSEGYRKDLKLAFSMLVKKIST